MEGVLERSQQPSTVFTDRETEAQRGRGEVILEGWQDQSKCLLIFKPALCGTDRDREHVWPFSTLTDGALSAFPVPW